MNKVVSIFSLFLLGFGIVLFNFFKKEEKLYEAKWDAPDTTLAITINGEVSTSFPTSANYSGDVVCSSGTGDIAWDGSKWILNSTGIIKGNTKCNITFVSFSYPDGWNEASSNSLLGKIRDNNTYSTPLTIPGRNVNGHVLSDVTATTTILVSSYKNYYWTYGTGWGANGTKFDLTGAVVSTSTYANSYSKLVGKYLVSGLATNNCASTTTMKTTTGLDEVYYVVSATSSHLTYKVLSSNVGNTEAVLTGAFDDYGTSYYFRGAVKNNYVKFANKCWRILRVTGNGAIKLVLHNDNSSNASSPCSSSYNSDTAAFANYSGTTQTSTFNAYYNDNAYAGFMYGVAGASNYSKAHANSNKSVILNNLETWYINNLASYDSRIADVIWCNDKSTFATFYDGSSMGEGLGYGTNQTTYTAYNRINGGSSSVYANPSLKCPKDNNGGNLSKFTVSDTTNGNGALTYKIGLLTADEAAFAGFKTSVYNRSNYLAENVGENYYWTMSPGYFDGSTGDVWRIHSGSLNRYYVGGTNNVRPAIALSSSAIVSGGSGTSEDPYVVN